MRRFQSLCPPPLGASASRSPTSSAAAPSAASSWRSTRASSCRGRRPSCSSSSALELPPGARVLDCCTRQRRDRARARGRAPRPALTGSDIDAGALAVARANAERLGLAVEWLRADLLDGLARPASTRSSPTRPTSRAGAIARSSRRSRATSRALALDGGGDGLESSPPDRAGRLRRIADADPSSTARARPPRSPRSASEAGFRRRRAAPRPRRDRARDLARRSA